MNIDAVLLLSFGGPEGPDQVMPFLENVTRGRGIPRERLVDVAEHYLHFGGVSPINGINRALIDELRTRVDLPVYFGNRNWEPYVEDAVAAMRDDGIGAPRCSRPRRGAGTPAVPNTSRTSRGPGRPPATRHRSSSNCASTTTIRCSCRCSATRSPPPRRPSPTSARLVFTAHSIPIAAGSRCGTDLYARQVAYAAKLVADAAGYDDYDQVWQSRSGPPRVPWLEPDVGDHLAALADSGAKAAIVCPIGFVADHIEVVWDLDHELRLQAEAAGVAFARAATPNADLARRCRRPARRATHRPRSCQASAPG